MSHKWERNVRRVYMSQISFMSHHETPRSINNTYLYGVPLPWNQMYDWIPANLIPSMQVKYVSCNRDHSVQCSYICGLTDFIHTIKRVHVNKKIEYHDDVIKWTHFPRHRSPVDSSHKGQWHGALIFSLICAWTNGWVNYQDAGDSSRHLLMTSL